MKKIEKENIIFLTVGLLLLTSELWKQYCLTYIAGGGSYQWSFIPWQLCSMPMYICLIIGICGIHRKNNVHEKKCESTEKKENAENNTNVKKPNPADKLKAACVTFLADFSLMSGAIAFLDTSGMHYDYAPLTVHSYLWHITIVLVGIYAGTRKRDKSNKTFIPAVVIYLAGVIIAQIINLNFDKYGIVNMFYINPHYYMNQIIFCDMIPYIGNNAVIALYIACTIAGAFIIHTLWKCALYRSMVK